MEGNKICKEFFTLLLSSKQQTTNKEKKNGKIIEIINKRMVDLTEPNVIENIDRPHGCGHPGVIIKYQMGSSSVKPLIGIAALFL